MQPFVRLGQAGKIRYASHTSFAPCIKLNNSHRRHYTSPQVPLEPITASLLSPLAARLQRAVDILIFNPPYVPTAYEEALAAQSSNTTLVGSAAWAGGSDGMLVTDRVLDSLNVSINPSFLSFSCIFSWKCYMN